MKEALYPRNKFLIAALLTARTEKKIVDYNLSFFRPLSKLTELLFVDLKSRVSLLSVRFSPRSGEFCGSDFSMPNHTDV